MEDLSVNQTPQTPEAAETAPATSDAAATPERQDPWSAERQAMREKKTVEARVIKWQRNGLEMQLSDGDKPAFMPNDMIDRDPNRNVANYFGKTLPVKITSVKAGPGSKPAEITVSHRAVLDEELRTAGRERIQSMNVGDVIEGKIKSFAKDNVLVDLGPGIDAVIRLRDLSWKRIEHPYEIAKRGETISAKILSLDKQRRRVQLGVKQLTDDPELTKYSEYAPQQNIKAKVLTTGPHGAELELPNGLVAFLPMSEIDWKRINAVTDVLNVGDEVEVQILTVSTDDRRITVSRKQLIEDPRRKVEQTFRVGSDHSGTIKEVNRGGVVLELEHGTEGFIPRRELSHDRIERLEDTFKAGKPLENARVIEFDRRTGRITLSLIAAEKEAQRSTLKNYRASSRASSYSLADSLAGLKAQLEQQEKK
jgi:small subunit ribosomal protein S1